MGTGGGGGCDHRQHFTFYDIYLTPNEAKRFLDQGGVALTAHGGGRRGDVIDEGRKAQAVMLQKSQGDLEDDDEKKTGHGAPLFDSVRGPEDLMFSTSNESGTQL